IERFAHSCERRVLGHYFHSLGTAHGICGGADHSINSGSDSAVNGHRDFRVGGRVISLSADSSSPCGRKVDLPGGLGQGRPGPPVHDDLVQRDFSADDVNELRLTDITEHWTDEGKLYLCAIKDVFYGRIVGYSIIDRMKARLTVNALDNAVSRRRYAAGCIVHSDCGSQFRSQKFVHALNRHHLIGSMDQVGAAGDNSAME